MISKRDFFNWLDEYATRKQNEIEYSSTRLPARGKVYSFKLDTAPTNPIIINEEFRQISARFYTTSTGAPYDGQATIFFDQDDIGNVAKSNFPIFNGAYVKNDILLKKAYLDYDAQSGITLELVFVKDGEYSSGSNDILNTVNTKEQSPIGTYVSNLFTVGLQDVLFNFVRYAEITVSSIVNEDDVLNVYLDGFIITNIVGQVGHTISQVQTFKVIGGSMQIEFITNNKNSSCTVIEVSF